MNELDNIKNLMGEKVLTDQDLDRLVHQAEDFVSVRPVYEKILEEIKEKAANIKKNRDMGYVNHLSGPEEVQKAAVLYNDRKIKGGEKNEDAVDSLCFCIDGFSSNYEGEDKNLGKATENCLRTFENLGFMELAPDYHGFRADNLYSAYQNACFLQGDSLSPAFARHAIENVEDMANHFYDPIANIAGMNYRLDDKNVAKTYLGALERTMDKYDHVTDGVISISNGLQDIIKANPDLAPKCNEIMNMAKDHMDTRDGNHNDAFCEYYDAVNSNPNVSESAKAMARVRKKGIEKQKDKDQGRDAYNDRNRISEIDKERDEMLERMEREYRQRKDKKDNEIDFSRHKSYGYGRDDGYGY